MWTNLIQLKTSIHYILFQLIEVLFRKTLLEQREIKLESQCSISMHKLYD